MITKEQQALVARMSQMAEDIRAEHYIKVIRMVAGEIWERGVGSAEWGVRSAESSIANSQ